MEWFRLRAGYIDETTHPPPNVTLDRIAPIIEKHIPGDDSRLLDGNLCHGLVSVPARQRRNHLVTQPGDYDNPIPTTSETALVFPNPD